MTNFDLAESTRKLILSAGLSLRQVSKLTTERYGAGSHYFIPDRLVSSIKNGVSPHLCQMVALSQATGYSFADWMQLFGFDLPHLTGLQMKLHTERTVLISPSEYFFVPRSSRQRYLYAQIGRQDSMGFPDVVPGSLVRLDTSHPFLSDLLSAESRRTLCVVDHLHGLSCCRVTLQGNDTIVLRSYEFPSEHLEYRLGGEARILGVVDAELRPLHNIEAPKPRSGHSPERRAPLTAFDKTVRLSRLIRNSRERVGAHFRRAHLMSIRVAQELKRNDCAIALGTLSDYEASDALPRHVSKIISLCALYAIGLGEFLDSAGIAINQKAWRPLPQSVRQPAIPSPALDPAKNSRPDPHGGASYFPPSILSGYIELLRSHSVGLRSYSIHTPVDGDDSPKSLFIVERGAARVGKNGRRATWRVPIHLVRKSGGKYTFGLCSVSDGMITIRRVPMTVRVVDRVNQKDAQVLGRVVAMQRTMNDLKVELESLPPVGPFVA